MLIDIHSHLDHCYFKDDLDEVIDNAKKVGLKVILTAGINPEKNRKSLEIAEKYDIVKACLGIYPIQYDNKEDNSNKKNSIIEKNSKKIINNENKINKNNIEKRKIKNNGKLNIYEEIKFIEKNKKNIIAIGEVGLDFHWDKNNVNGQKRLFEKMIKLTEKLNKPIIVHSRKAEEDVINMLQR